MKEVKVIVPAASTFCIYADKMEKCVCYNMILVTKLLQIEA